MNKRCETLLILQGALRYIRKGWCRGWFARTKEGYIVNELNSRACKWCAAGALSRATHDLLDVDYLLKDPAGKSAHERVIKELPRDYSIVGFNDRRGRKKRDVVRVFERAIKKLEKEIAR